jgi:diguanylate cyclase (GGDEF)-like protein
VTPDPTLRLDRRGRPVGAGQAEAAALLEVLDAGSREALLAALPAPGDDNLELVTLDGRVLDAVLSPADDEVLVTVRDVTRYAMASEQLGSMAVSLARRNRDLKLLYEAAAALDTTQEVGGIAQTTARLVGEYLDAVAVEVQVLEETFAWPAGDDAGASGRPEPDPELHLEVHPLGTARGPLGALRWWRASPLVDNEAETLPLLISRAAIGLDHALLLSSAEQRAARDELTGLLNRSGARQALAGLVAPFPVALLDLDHFKAINDQHGHPEGDRVLREVAELLASGRDSDVKARWGGEEFLVALPHATVHHAVLWLEDRLEAVRSAVVVGDRPVTFSAGVALVDDEGLEAGLRAADDALYRAKDEGRARVRAHQPHAPRC